MSDQTVSHSKSRGQFIAGLLAGAVVFALLVTVFFLVRSGDEEPAAQQAAATRPAAEQSTSPAEPSAPPAAGGAAALQQEPEVKPGTGAVSKIAITEIVAGTGPEVKSGQTILVNYKVIQYATGDLIDSSWGKQPFETQIGVGRLIKGWDQAIPGQKVGSRLQLDVPAALAYGPQQGDLRFVVDILDAR